MFGVVDAAARLVLLFVDLLLFALGQVAAIERAVRARLLIDRCLPLFQTSSLARCQLTGGDSAGNTILLVLTPLVDFIIPVVLRCGVVFVLVDLLAQIVLLPVDDPLFLRR